jgi:type II secretory pathway component PulJ
MTRTTTKRPPPRSLAAEAGMTIMEIMVGITIMAIAAGSIAFLIGAAVQAKMITAVRAGDTESVRESLGRMAERLRNAGFNIKLPSAQPNRCWDRVVAQDPLLKPTASSLYVSGEILKTDTVAGDQLATIGYYVAADPVTSVQVVQEYYQTCAGGATNIAANSTPLSNPRIPVTGLTFTYYNSGGVQVTDLVTTSSIQTIVFAKISMTVQASEGRSGTQTATLSRYVMFRQPEPNANSWIDINENY